MLGFNRLFLLVISLLLSACSSTTHRPYHSSGKLPLCKSYPEPLLEKITTMQSGPSADKAKLVVHSGLLMGGTSWGGNRAAKAGRFLQKNGYIGEVLEARSRFKKPLLAQLLKAGGGNIIGLHYSIGGAPHVFGAALAAVTEVARSTDSNIKYDVIMVDPYDFKGLARYADLNSDVLGHVFVIFSGRQSFLRPQIGVAAQRIAKRSNFHLVYAEDFGVKWSHFSFLTSLKSTDTRKVAVRGREVFAVALNSIVQGKSYAEAERALDHLRVKYALVDGRKIIHDLCRMPAS